jgi:4-amino-4-deoxy-L-arabinose transferase-like glycosyltransferase
MTWRYLIIAGALHVALTTAIFTSGRFRILPNTFDQNGVGLTFAIDGTSYQQVASDLATVWQTNGFGAWLKTKAPFHSRLHSLSFFTFGRLLGHNILGAEPLNLFYYLAILTLIYFLGRAVFSARTGFVAATIVALWPSFLFHSTQLIRDPLSISCFLALLLVLTLLLKRSFTWRASVVLGIGAALLVTIFWLTRGNMWNAVLVTIAIAFVMLIGRMIRARTFMPGNALVMVLILAAALLVPTRLESTSLPGVRPPTTPLAIPSATQGAPREGVWTRAIKQIGERRAGFRFYKSYASNIDTGVQLRSAGDILRFVPRAFVIGFCAPFPNMWVQAGNFGRAGRLVSGLETLAMYVLYLAVAVCLWQERRNLRMWLLFLVATIGMLALGLVVVNAGALYRIRYVFWMMLIVIAAEGIARLAYLTVFRTSLTKSRTSSSEVSNEAIKRTSEISSFQT